MNNDITRLNTVSPTDPLLKVPECAEYLRLSVTVVRELISDGELPVVKYRRRTFVRQSGADDFIKRHTYQTNTKHEQGEQ